MPSASPNFDFIAPVYDALARLVFGRTQLKAQAYFLSLVPDGANVLLVGGGSGLILQELFRVTTPRHVLYLEPSGGMIKQAKEKIQSSAFARLVEFRKGTEQDLAPEETFDVIITPFVLDLFTQQQVKEMVSTLDAALLPGSFWLHTDFQLSASMAKRIWQKPMVWAMYWFFRRVSGISAKNLPDVKPLFQELQYDVRQEAFFYGAFIKTQVWQKPSGKD